MALMFVNRGPDRLDRIHHGHVAGDDTKRLWEAPKFGSLCGNKPSAALNRAERAGGEVGVGGGLPTRRAINWGDDTSHSTTKGGEHWTGTLQ